MIKEIYASNFRSLVNFRIALDNFTLILGPNGSGKSAVFDVVRKIATFVGRGEAVDDVFVEADITRGLIDEKAEQEFEIRAETTKGTYTYTLTIEFRAGEGLERVGRETLSFGSTTLYDFSAKDGGRARLFRDNGSAGPEVLADWSRSGLSVLQARHDNTLLTEFKERMANTFVIRMNPALIGAESRDESRRPLFDLSNFASWYRYLVQTEQSKVFRAVENLRSVLPGFDSLSLVEAGEGKLLSAIFRNPGGGRSSFRLHQLSEGQRALIGLYVLLHCVPDPVSTLMIDEPENFVGLPEIQPWLDALYDWTGESAHQAVLVSHHPIVVNLLAKDNGIWVDRRESVGFSQARKITEATDGMSVADLVERGWVYDYVGGE